MDEILDIPEIFINENNRSSKYYRMYDINECPYYILNGSNYNAPDGMTKIYTVPDEIIFLPINKSNFININNEYHFGFRYFLRFTNQETVSIGINPALCGITTIQLCTEIHRIRYEIIGNDHIVINKNYDELHPPAIVSVQTDLKEASTLIDKVVTNIIAEYNKFYINRHI